MEPNLLVFTVTILLLIALQSAFTASIADNNEYLTVLELDDEEQLRRSIRNAPVTPIIQLNIVPPKPNITEICEPPAADNFPPDIFGQWLRSHGFIVIHFGVVCYMFYCLAVVCDNYFLPSLEECAKRLHLSEDVAGATFMAAGSSAPELFTAILGVFIAKDVGTGTIVGSAVFNILFVIGLCGIFTASTQLNWWPVARDAGYYALTVFVLILVLYDGEVTTFESSLMLILYVVYIIIMALNARIRDWIVPRLPLEKLGLPNPDPEANRLNAQPTTGYGSNPQDVWATPPETGTWLKPSEDFYKMSMFEAANHLIIEHRWLFRPRSRFIAAANLIRARISKHRVYARVAAKAAAGPSKAELKRALTTVRQDTLTAATNEGGTPEVTISDLWMMAPNPLVEGWFPVVKWSLQYPLHAALHYTIPDCRRYPVWFLATFILSVTWTAFFSYIMVWMVTLIGFTFGIPDSIMGITFLAAGTSIPDAYASIHVARAGQGDMAVSNSIGSNVFDILVGLALPWFLQTAVVEPGTIAYVKSMGLAYAVVLLFVTLVLTVIFFHVFKWTLNPKLGISLLITYALFLVCSIALEFNLLGDVNPPMCNE